MDAPDESEKDLHALLQEWTPAVGRVAASYVAGEEREDLAQDILLALWESLPRFRGESSMRTFVYRIAHNRAIDFVRKRSNRPATDPTDELVSNAPAVDRVAGARREKQRLLAAVRALSLTYRQPLTMVLEGLSYVEIAEILGITESNVGVRVHRARQRLRELMDAKEES